MKNLFCLIIILAIYSCKKDKLENNNIVQPQSIQLDSFPLTIGNSWKYHTEWHITDSTGVNSPGGYYDNYWNVISDTTINGIHSVRILQLDSNYDGMTHLAYTYYANKPDGFYGMAVENSGSMFLLRTSGLYAQTHLDFTGSFENTSTTTDTVIVTATSLRFLKFPSSLYDIWLSYEYNSPIPDIIKRKYIGYSTVTTIAGTFDCIKLQMFWDYDNNNQPDSGTTTAYQYFSTKGLIQEEKHSDITFSGIPGIFTQHQVTKLVHVNF